MESDSGITPEMPRRRRWWTPEAAEPHADWTRVVIGWDGRTAKDDGITRTRVVPTRTRDDNQSPRSMHYIRALVAPANEHVLLEQQP